MSDNRALILIKNVAVGIYKSFKSELSRHLLHLRLVLSVIIILPQVMQYKCANRFISHDLHIFFRAVPRFVLALRQVRQGLSYPDLARY